MDKWNLVSWRTLELVAIYRVLYRDCINIVGSWNVSFSSLINPFNPTFLNIGSLKALFTFLKIKKRHYPPHYRSDKGCKGTVANQTLPSLHGGSLEISLTVPLKLILPLKDVPEVKDHVYIYFFYLFNGLSFVLNYLSFKPQTKE